LTAAQQAELRALALRTQAESPHRGRGVVGGAYGRNATEVLMDWLAEMHGIEMSIRGMQALPNRLGLEYQHRAQARAHGERAPATPPSTGTGVVTLLMG
jgi:hypothetical protein